MAADSRLKQLTGETLTMNERSTTGLALNIRKLNQSLNPRPGTTPSGPSPTGSHSRRKHISIPNTLQRGPRPVPSSQRQKRDVLCWTSEPRQRRAPSPPEFRQRVGVTGQETVLPGFEDPTSGCPDCFFLLASSTGFSNWVFWLR